MFTNKLTRHGEHLLRYGSLQIGGLFAERVDPVGLLDMAGEVFLLVLPRVEELFGRGGEGNHHHRFARLEVRVGEAGVQVARTEVAPRLRQPAAPAPDALHVGEDAGGPVGRHRIVYPHPPIVLL